MSILLMTAWNCIVRECAFDWRRAVELLGRALLLLAVLWIFDWFGGSSFHDSSWMVIGYVNGVGFMRREMEGRAA
jgi:hypothetical protein